MSSTYTTLKGSHDQSIRVSTKPSACMYVGTYSSVHSRPYHEGTEMPYHHQTPAVVQMLGTKTPSSVIRAFELIGGILVDVGRAIGECVKEAAELAARISTAAKALSGNVLAIIKVVVDEFVHIWQDRKEITDDCKTTAADWRAGDFEGAGAAVGNITKIIIDGLQAEVEVEAA